MAFSKKVKQKLHENVCIAAESETTTLESNNSGSKESETTCILTAHNSSDINQSALQTKRADAQSVSSPDIAAKMELMQTNETSHESDNLAELTQAETPINLSNKTSTDEHETISNFAQSPETSLDTEANQTDTSADCAAAQIAEIAQTEINSLADSIAQAECNGGSCSIGDKKSDKPNKKKKHIWLKRLISVGLVLILGVFSGSILANWYKRTIEASKFDYTQFDVSAFYDDTHAIVASATGMSNPSEDDLKNFAVLAKSSGKTPLNFTPSQNYILAEFNAKNSSSFSAVGTGKVATIATQTIYTRKLYDGKAYTNENISVGLLTVATCSHYEKGGHVVRLVNGTNATDTSATWNGNEARYGTEEFVDMTGCLPDTILPYIISSKTIIDENKVAINQTERGGKTVYEFTISLHNVYAVLNYQKQVKFTSGLADSPVFSDISVKIIIDENWNFVRTEIVEHYTVIYGITASCEGTLNTDYTFNEPVELPIK